ncbi:tetratricopeptide repeat protein, partial [Candidatus Aerophobetes bacterium]
GMNKKKNLIMGIFLLAGVSFLFSNLVQQETAKELFERGLYFEETKGDLEKAIDVYKQIVKKFPHERTTAAQAQLHLGYCFEKLGLKEAQKAYQNVIDKYPEQKEVVKIAKEKLSILLKAQALAEKGEKEFRIRKVCEGSDVDVSGEVSPDGRYISYTDWETFGHLAIYEIATGKKHDLTNQTEDEHWGNVIRSSWSPDSKQIAYMWWNEDAFWDLRIIGIDGSKPRVLYRDKDVFPQPADWSPDGKHILTILENYYKDKVNQVGLISVRDGTVSILETLKGRAVYYLYFSPDGRYIAYDYPQKERSQDRDVFIYSIEEKREIPLVQHLANDHLGGWTPDGKNILFGSNRLGTMDVWAISVEEGKAQGSPRLVKKDIGLVSPMGFAPDGSFYYGLRINIRDVYVGTLDKEREKFLVPPEKLTGYFVGRNVSPEWSPDGKYLAYISIRHPDLSYGSNSLYIRDLETGEEREVVRPPEIRWFGSFFMGGISWSPDGRSIILTGRDKKGQGIYVVDVKTGEMTTLLHSEVRLFSPSWSADGKAVFFTERHDKEGISPVFRYDMKTKEKKEIYNQNPGIFYMAPSPDGKLLAFATFEKYKEETIGVLMVLPVEGGEPREVVKITDGGCMALAWAPDSREIIYGKSLYAPSGSQRIEQGSELWKVSVEGGEPQKLWKMADQIVGVRVHPDGQRLAFTSQTSWAEIW